MTLRQRVTEMLQRMPGSGILVDINEGRPVPPLTDYYLRPVPEGWAAPPPSLVDDLKLLPAFTNNDYTVYCIDPATNRLLAIDMEAPWPPAQVFTSCHEFLAHFLRVVQENQSEEVAKRLQELLEDRSGNQ